MAESHSAKIIIDKISLNKKINAYEKVSLFVKRFYQHSENREIG